jgi:protein TonB
MGLLHPQSARRAALGRRGVVLTAIAGLHTLAVAGLLHMGLRPEATVEEPVMQTVFLSADVPEVSAPELKPEFEPPPVQLPVMQVPQIQIAAETAITVAWVPEPPRAPVPPPVAAVAVDASIPVPLEAIDYLDQARPQYPPQAKRARAQGTVYLRVIIDPEGRPREVHIERSSGFALLDHAAREALLKSLFRPYRENGVARSASAIVPVRFSLNSRKS